MKKETMQQFKDDIISTKLMYALIEQDDPNQYDRETLLSKLDLMSKSVRVLLDTLERIVQAQELADSGLDFLETNSDSGSVPDLVDSDAAGEPDRSDPDSVHNIWNEEIFALCRFGSSAVSDPDRGLGGEFVRISRSQGYIFYEFVRGSLYGLDGRGPDPDLTITKWSAQDGCWKELKVHIQQELIDYEKATGLSREDPLMKFRQYAHMDSQSRRSIN